MYIHYDGLKLIFVVLLFFSALWLFRRRQKNRSAIGFAIAYRFEGRLTVKLFAHYVGVISFWIAVALFLFAITNPRSIGEAGKEKISKKGIAIWLLLDTSSSMKDPFEATSSKIDALKDLCRRIIHERPNDVIGIMTFARRVHFVCPLTLDREALLSRAETIKAVDREDEDGTAIGYALFRAINLVVSVAHFDERLKEQRAPSYNIENQIILLVTDGLQSPNPGDRNHPFRFMSPANALSFAADNRSRVYCIGLVPLSQREEFRRHCGDIIEGVEKTGGRFSLASDTKALSSTYAEIDRLEKSSYIPEGAGSQEESLVPIITLWGILFLALGVACETLFARTVP